MIPARCNRRSCQARRNLSKPLKEYKKPPRCHVPGCQGLMYVDRYRMKVRRVDSLRHKDTGKVCYDDCFRFPHKWGSIGCRHRGEYVKHIVANPSRHTPFKPGPETEQDWALYGKDIPVDQRSHGQH